MIMGALGPATMRKFFTKRRLIWLSIFVAVTITGLAGAAYSLSRHLEPFIRERTISYLRAKYKAEVEIEALHVSMPMRYPLALLLAKGHGTHLEVQVSNVVIRQTRSTDIPPLISIRKVR